MMNEPKTWQVRSLLNQLDKKHIVPASTTPHLFRELMCWSDYSLQNLDLKLKENITIDDFVKIFNNAERLTSSSTNEIDHMSKNDAPLKRPPEDELERMAFKTICSKCANYKIEEKKNTGTEDAQIHMMVELTL